MKVQHNSNEINSQHLNQSLTGGFQPFDQSAEISSFTETKQVLTFNVTPEVETYDQIQEKKRKNMYELSKNENSEIKKTQESLIQKILDTFIEIKKKHPYIFLEPYEVYMNNIHHYQIVYNNGIITDLLLYNENNQLLVSIDLKNIYIYCLDITKDNQSIKTDVKPKKNKLEYNQLTQFEEDELIVFINFLENFIKYLKLNLSLQEKVEKIEELLQLLNQKKLNNFIDQETQNEFGLDVYSVNKIYINKDEIFFFHKEKQNPFKIKMHPDYKDYISERSEYDGIQFHLNPETNKVTNISFYQKGIKIYNIDIQEQRMDTYKNTYTIFTPIKKNKGFEVEKMDKMSFFLIKDLQENLLKIDSSLLFLEIKNLVKDQYIKYETCTHPLYSHIKYKFYLDSYIIYIDEEKNIIIIDIYYQMKFLVEKDYISYSLPRIINYEKQGDNIICYEKRGDDITYCEKQGDSVITYNNGILINIDIFGKEIFLYNPKTYFFYPPVFRKFHLIRNDTQFLNFNYEYFRHKYEYSKKEFFKEIMSKLQFTNINMDLIRLIQSFDYPITDNSKIQSIKLLTILKKDLYLQLKSAEKKNLIYDTNLEQLNLSLKLYQAQRIRIIQLIQEIQQNITNSIGKYHEDYNIFDGYEFFFNKNNIYIKIESNVEEYNIVIKFCSELSGIEFFKKDCDYPFFTIYFTTGSYISSKNICLLDKNIYEDIEKCITNINIHEKIKNLINLFLTVMKNKPTNQPSIESQTIIINLLKIFKEYIGFKLNTVIRKTDKIITNIQKYLNFFENFIKYMIKKYITIEKDFDYIVKNIKIFTNNFIFPKTLQVVTEKGYMITLLNSIIYQILLLDDNGRPIIILDIDRYIISFIFNNYCKNINLITLENNINPIDINRKTIEDQNNFDELMVENLEKNQIFNNLFGDIIIKIKLLLNILRTNKNIKEIQENFITIINSLFLFLYNIIEIKRNNGAEILKLIQENFGQNYIIYILTHTKYNIRSFENEFEKYYNIFIKDQDFYQNITTEGNYHSSTYLKETSIKKDILQIKYNKYIFHIDILDGKIKKIYLIDKNQNNIICIHCKKELIYLFYNNFIYRSINFITLENKILEQHIIREYKIYFKYIETILNKILSNEQKIQLNEDINIKSFKDMEKLMFYTLLNSNVLNDDPNIRSKLRDELTNLQFNELQSKKIRFNPQFTRKKTELKKEFITKAIEEYYQLIITILKEDPKHEDFVNRIFNETKEKSIKKEVIKNIYEKISEILKIKYNISLTEELQKEELHKEYDQNIIERTKDFCGKKQSKLIEFLFKKSIQYENIKILLQFIEEDSKKNIETYFQDSSQYEDIVNLKFQLLNVILYTLINNANKTINIQPFLELIQNDYFKEAIKNYYENPLTYTELINYFKEMIYNVEKKEEIQTQYIQRMKNEEQKKKQKEEQKAESEKSYRQTEVEYIVDDITEKSNLTQNDTYKDLVYASDYQDSE